MFQVPIFSISFKKILENHFSYACFNFNLPLRNPKISSDFEGVWREASISVMPPPPHPKRDGGAAHVGSHVTLDVEKSLLRQLLESRRHDCAVLMEILL